MSPQQPEHGSSGRDTVIVGGSNINSIVTLNSVLTHVRQSIDSVSSADDAAKAQLQHQIDALEAALRQVPPDQSEAAQAVAESAKALVDEAAKPQPNKDLVNWRAETLEKIAVTLAAVVPPLMPVVTKITKVVLQLIGI